MITTQTDWTISSVPSSLLRERARSFPFLTDGRALFVIQGWRADQAPRERFAVRRLSREELSRVEASLRDAAEEVSYRLRRPPAINRRPRKTPPAPTEE